MDTESGIGLELIQRHITLILFNQLNTEIDAQQQLWESRDANWNAQTGKDPDYVLIEQIEPDNFHCGHRPSLIENPSPDNYPNASVMVYQSRPSEDVFDQASNFSITCDLEIMVKGPDEFQTDARTHRTIEAVHNVLTKNDRLDGMTSGWENDPVIQITDIFKKKEENSYGDQWFWQASRLRYVTTKHNKLPSWA